jgi:hypothetical protein
MKKETAQTLRAFLIELAIYSVLVVVYFFLVLHFLGETLQRLEHNHHVGYAIIAVLLMIGQAVLLQYTTTFLLRFIRGRAD